MNINDVSCLSAVFAIISSFSTILMCMILNYSGNSIWLKCDQCNVFSCSSLIQQGNRGHEPMAVWIQGSNQSTETVAQEHGDEATSSGPQGQFALLCVCLLACCCLHSKVHRMTRAGEKMHLCICLYCVNIPVSWTLWCSLDATGISQIVKQVGSLLGALCWAPKVCNCTIAVKCNV